ncbi:hypothetical protein CEUSTIGMA_g6504.t1 [Chlamydomonas eustigma]|uniref:CobW C-terminal domain-containing protein n=1 Tax=Chlamydomonas eustigma TaxID=1157962 RepID=A0A250X7K0_9CHLO|nr:hypothetical protein CEUSTIGMA_g6504.t1 [Chlamydomonas eustigma]|eukprot:GAX79064.1 hypothetical protein CEUSTIGMA_g6504.t1 [Chlamydomonas eustigma]
MAASMAKTKVTMLSGFLGAGKTTLLRYVLENSKEKIACIVNDVASINIDAKLVRNDRNRARGEQVNTTADLADTIELQNGCACCSLQDELFASFEKVLAMGDKRGEPYSRIILENSGVAEPQNIRDKFAEALSSGHPVMDRIELDTLVTVLDSATFIADYASRAPLASRPELGEGGNLRPVVDLLVEQVECADYVVCNKMDMLIDPSQLEQLMSIVASLNPLASVMSCQQGKVPIEVVFGSCASGVMSKLNVEGQHRGAVAAAKALKAKVEAEEKKHHHHHEHHEHEHHHHHHEHSHAEDGKEHDDCQACSHNSGKKRAHSHVEDGKEHDDCKACEHEHHHDHSAEGDCAECVHHDHTGHDHHHHHHDKHEHKHNDTAETTAAKRFGIRNFVYSRRKPFHPQRLKEMVLKWLPVSSNKAIDGEAPSLGDSPIKSVLRSKGFMWMSNSHTTAFYWSHAGQHFEIRDEGDWWVSVSDDEWPEDPAQRAIVVQDFDLSTEFGDRRQEIVFIGVGMEEDKICEQLDGALLTDEEMIKYVQRWSSHVDPQHPEVLQMKKQ